MEQSSSRLQKDRGTDPSIFARPQFLALAEWYHEVEPICFDYLGGKGLTRSMNGRDPSSKLLDNLICDRGSLNEKGQARRAWPRRSALSILGAQKTGAFVLVNAADRR